MALCIIGIFIFGVLGIFSAKYRTLAQASVKCALKMALFKPCESTLDQKAKALFVSELMKVSHPMARIVYKNFAAFSWLLIFLFIGSAAAIVWGAYNYYTYGNCNGESSAGFCPFSELQTSASANITSMFFEGRPVKGNLSAKINIIEFACFQCPYSKEAEPAIKRVLDTYPEKVKLMFVFFPLPQHKNGQLAARAGVCANKQEKFWQLHGEMFDNQHLFNNSVNSQDAYANIESMSQSSGLNMDEFRRCINSSEAAALAMEDYEAGRKLRLQGTPTFFINEKRLTGPLPFSTFKKEIESIDT